MTALKTTFASGDAFTPGTTSSTDALNGITNRINQLQTSNNPAFITAFSFGSGNESGTSNEGRDAIAGTGSFQNMAAMAATSGDHDKIFIDWSNFQITGATTKFIFQIRYLVENGSTEKTLQIQVCPLGAALANSTVTGVADGTWRTASTGWVNAPTSGTGTYEIGWKVDNAKTFAFFAAQLLVAPFWN